MPVTGGAILLEASLCGIAAYFLVSCIIGYLSVFKFTKPVTWSWGTIRALLECGFAVAYLYLMFFRMDEWVKLMKRLLEVLAEPL
ncbi:hypothetical protein F5Y13DRAFT_156752 [Hypoxylon sp. FL1857]|nr:hypothetical protein F5Y13DRAFT_156752 [Hypoxylon sp. FL1857]